MRIWDLRRTWWSRRICAPEDFDLFFTNAGAPGQKPGKATQARLDQAKEICAMCPVMEECRRSTPGEEYGVWGGLDQHERWELRKQLHEEVKGWPKERRLAAGRELHEYRSAGMRWHDIKPSTGLQDKVSQELVDEWLEHQKANPEKPARKPARPQVVRLEAVAFPDKPGHRHGWVRQNRMIADAWYRAQTPDGRYLLMNTAISGREVVKWVEAKDVKLYQSPPVIIRELRRIRGSEYLIHNPAA